MVQRLKCPSWLFLRIRFSWEMSRLRIYLRAIIRKISEWNSIRNTTEHFRYKPLICIIELLTPALRTMVGVGRCLSWQIACHAYRHKDLAWLSVQHPHTGTPVFPSIREVEAGGSLGHQLLTSALTNSHTHVYPYPQTWAHTYTNNMSLFLLL